MRCKCGADLVFVETPKGKKMPVVAGSPRRMVSAFESLSGERIVIVTDEGNVVTGWETKDPTLAVAVGRISHWADCPNAGEFRREKRHG